MGIKVGCLGFGAQVFDLWFNVQVVKDSVDEKTFS